MTGSGLDYHRRIGSARQRITRFTNKKKGNEMNIPHRTLALAILTAILSACATPTYIKAYAGPEMPPEQVALVKPTVGVQVVAINGDTTFAVKTARSVGYLEVEMALPPGQYRFEVRLNHGDVWSRGTTTLDLNAQAGGKYLITYAMANRAWQPRIDDVTMLPDQWCALASSSNFKGCAAIPKILK